MAFPINLLSWLGSLCAIWAWWWWWRWSDQRSMYPDNLCVCLSICSWEKIWCYFSLGISKVFKKRQKHSVEHCLQLGFLPRLPEKSESCLKIYYSSGNVHLTYTHILEQYTKFRLAVRYIFLLKGIHQFISHSLRLLWQLHQTNLFLPGKKNIFVFLSPALKSEKM